MLSGNLRHILRVLPVAASSMELVAAGYAEWSRLNVSRIPDPPPFHTPSRIPACIIARAPLARRASSELSDPIDPRLRGEPHTVDMVPSLRGSVTLIGYDRAGEPMVELRLPRGKYRPQMARRLERWLRENDDTPVPLRAI